LVIKVKKSLAFILTVVTVLSFLTFSSTAATTTPTGLTLSYAGETVAGVWTSMEFSTNGGSTWASIASSNVPLKIASYIPAATAASDAEVQVRLKAASGQPASLPVSFVLPKRPVTPTSAEVKYDCVAEQISIPATAVYEYSPTYDGSYTALPLGTASFSYPALSSGTQSVYVRLKATSTDFASSYRLISTPKRAALPTTLPAYDGSNDLIKNVTTAMEYSADDGTSWTTADGTVIPRSALGDAEKTVLIRVKATTSTPRSDNMSVNLPANPNAKTVLTLVSKSANSITVSWIPIDGATGYEISCGGNVVTVTGAGSATISGLMPNTAYELKVRVLKGSDVGGWRLELGAYRNDGFRRTSAVRRDLHVRRARQTENCGLRVRSGNYLQL
jgi:hypothetical protein